MLERLIRLYRLFSLVKHRALFTLFGFTTRCKHEPSCSRYAEIQLRERGTIVGSIRALTRILTCW